MRHHHSPVSYRRRGTGTRTTGTPFVLAGQKDVYDWSNPADHAEYRIVLSYHQR
ncbi:hypothetical protein [Catellatospora sp. TT07R-123]|uniref:hypothetical protein n=1 Tax=Catellatospora sp. TT07R-123 TaxID=2733863 RepID=UPI001BB407D5|nr:hypothetical protein [Catellatospora sp. TT07R-123]